MSVFSLAACTKDMVDDYGGVIPEGECSVTADVEFKPLAAGLNGATRSAGNAIKEIENLQVLLYDENQKLVESHSITDFTTNADEDRTDADADNGHTAESKTPRAAFDLKIPYGRYYIYAVANMGDLADEDVATVGDLKSVSLKWNGDNVASNNQMFGCFIVGDADAKEPKDDPLITVAQKSMSLHAWIRRAASKVTVAFDASGLKDNIYIYLKSVQIKDIPSHCLLGKDNKPASDAELIREGETIEYAKGNTTWDDNYPARITNGNPVYGAAKLTSDAEARSVDEQIAAQHGEDVAALYFYENMQGQGISKKQDWKEQGKVTFPDGSNKDDAGNLNSPNRKDQMLYGTYIEVKAHYVSRNAGDMSEGDITYRFMLGKDTDKDYDAQRNYHYKLTMKFKGYANDVDWHIDYEREKGIIIPNPYYISYLYNHSMMLPVQVNTEPGVTVTGLKAEIIDNRWAPNEPDKDFVYLKDVDKEGQNLWNGFLSLHETTKTVISGPTVYNSTSNKDYYEGTSPEGGPNRGVREYDVSEGSHASEYKDTDKYSVKIDGLDDPKASKVYHFSLPMYTRAKQLVKETAYTGNNPYVAYQRKAVVRITATLSKGDPYIKDVTIYQVRRIVNPKGIWREADSKNTKPFHVVLKRLPKESATKFESFNSDGPWRAYVIKEFPENNGPVTLSVSDPSISAKGKADIEFDGKTLKDVDIISGRTDTPIDFNIDFKGSIGADESRYAVVRVEYHNNTCYHLIFVRQGNSPDNLVEGSSTKWHAMNMESADKEASSPIDEGSLFKFGNLKDPIKATENKNKGKSPWVNVVPDDFKTGQEYGKEAWNKITNQPYTGSFSDPTVNGRNIRVASYNDFKELYTTTEIEQGYGVLYGDEATEVLEDIDQVYGYDNEKSGTFGMRGCFVYNRNTGKNLFFPIGASGYGHRKHKVTGAGSDHMGLLRYSCNGRWGYFDVQAGHTKYTEGFKGAPLFYDLFMRPGAIYWLKQNQGINDIAVNDDDKKGGVIGWDFNYFTFDFFTISQSNVFSGDNSDACFVRCVEK